MLVILDANVLVADFFRTSNPFQLLLGQAARLGITVAVPEIACNEAAQQYSLQLNAAWGKLRRVDAELSRLGVNFDDPFEYPGWTSVRVREWETKLRADIATAGGLMLTLPTISHQDMLAWLRARQPPARDGASYKDVLVWESLVEAAPPSGSTVLVSADSDFAELEGDGLAGHLVADFARRCPHASIDLVPSLRVFVERHVAPALPLEEEFGSDLTGTDLIWKIERSLAEQVEAQGVDASLLTFDDAPATQTAWVIGVEDISDLEIHDSRATPDGRVFFDVHADLRLLVEYLFDVGPNPHTPKREQALPPIPDRLRHGISTRHVFAVAEGSYRAGNRQLERLKLKSAEAAN